MISLTKNVMSIDIDWDTLTSGTSGRELSDSIRDFIHEKFQQVQLPHFIRSVEIRSFEFGSECPVVSLKDITDPLPEFYDDSESESTSEEEEEPIITGRDTLNQQGRPPPTINVPERGFPFFPSRVSTPGPGGVPGTASNLSYFHLPLSAGLSGTATPNAAFPPPWARPDYHHHNRPPSPPRTVDGYADPSSRPSTAHGRTQSGAFETTTASPLHPADGGDQAKRAQPQEERDPMDTQIVLHISYSGSLSLSMTAEILLDFPMPSFMGIPLKLRISGLEFDGVALLAYLRDNKKKNGDAEEESNTKIKFAFLAPADAETMIGEEGIQVVGDDNDGQTHEVDGKRVKEDNGPIKKQDKDKAARFGSLLSSLNIESEIGRTEDGKQVLKNVGKVERFILEQVRRIFEEEFVWPSFWTFLV